MKSLKTFVKAGVLTLLLVALLAGRGRAGDCQRCVSYDEYQQYDNTRYPQPYFSTSGGNGTAVRSTDTVTVRFKVELQLWTDQVRLYYTTDGSPRPAQLEPAAAPPPGACIYEGTFTPSEW